MGQYKQLAGQTLIYGLGTIVPRFLNYFVLTPFYTRIFKDFEYGIVNEFYAYIVFLLILLTYGTETGYFRFAKEEKNRGEVFSTIMTSIFTTTVLFFLVVFLFYQDIARFLEYEQNSYLILLFTSVVAIDAFSAVPFAKLRFQNKAKKFGLLKIFNVIANLFFNVIFFVLMPYLKTKFPGSPLLLLYNEGIGVGYVFISNLLAGVFTLILLLPELKIRLSLIQFSLLKQILKYSLPLLFVGLSGAVNEVADKFFLKILIPGRDESLSQIGIYSANYKLGMLMTIFIQMFRYAAEPFYFNKMKDKDAKKVYANVMKYFILFGFFLFLFVILYLDVLKHFIGSDYHSGLKIVPIILIANLFLGVVYNLSIWYKLTNLTKYGAMIAFIGAGITVVFNILLIPHLGYVGSAWTTLICYMTMAVISYSLSRKYYKIPYNIKSISLYAAIVMGIFLLQNYIEYPGLILKVIINSLFLLGFIIVLIYREKITYEDVRNFLRRG
ncbi:MAG: oligosaccharide flippase family protein [Bacteroidales bacterium]